jgi:hypothetical protein
MATSGMRSWALLPVDPKDDDALDPQRIIAARPMPLAIPSCASPAA